MQNTGVHEAIVEFFCYSYWTTPLLGWPQCIGEN